MMVSIRRRPDMGRTCSWMSRLDVLCLCLCAAPYPLCSIIIIHVLSWSAVLNCFSSSLLFSSSFSPPLLLVTYCCPSIKIACPHLWNSPLLRPGDAHSSTTHHCPCFSLSSPWILHPTSAGVSRGLLREKQTSRRVSGREKRRCHSLNLTPFRSRKDPLPTNQRDTHLSAGKKRKEKRESSNDRNGNGNSNLFRFRSTICLFPRGGKPRFFGLLHASSLSGPLFGFSWLSGHDNAPFDGHPTIFLLLLFDYTLDMSPRLS